MLTFSLLFLAGTLGGVINSLAGGGSFVIFPALLAAGLPPVAANATNTFSCMPGYLAGAWAFRRDLAAYRHKLPALIGVCLLGGASGAALLLSISPDMFETVIPWLLLVATVLFVTGKRLSTWLMRQHGEQDKVRSFALLMLMLAVATYGGFFNAGLGIITLAYLALAGYEDINVMNGFKLLMSTAISVAALGLFIINGQIWWPEGLATLIGTVTGGYLAAHLSRRLPQIWVRSFVLAISLATTAYFFYDVYGR